MRAFAIATREPCAARRAILTEEAEIQVRRMVAEHPDAVEEPIVEEFTSPHLGAGIRAMCYIPDEEDGSINVGLRYGWYVPELRCQAHLFTFAPDPGHVHSALDDIDELARAIRYVTL